MGLIDDRINQVLILIRTQSRIGSHPRERNEVSRSLIRSTTPGSVRSNALEIDSGRDDFDVVERELRALSDNFSVEGDEGASIVVESISVTSLLIRVEVETARLGSLICAECQP